MAKLLYKNRKGFSLIEIIISISILAIISSSAFVWFINYQRQTELDSVSKIIISVLRDAQSRSTSGTDNKKWGVLFDNSNNKLILFRDEGFGYATATIKEENYLSQFIKIDESSLAEGCNEIIFINSKGNTAKNCVIKIVDLGNDNNFINISITSLGLISRN